jgi:hypothetical protein
LETRGSLTNIRAMGGTSANSSGRYFWMQLRYKSAAPLTIELSSALEAKFTEICKTEVFCTQSWGLTVAHAA